MLNDLFYVCYWCLALLCFFFFLGGGVCVCVWGGGVVDDFFFIGYLLHIGSCRRLGY